MSYGMAASLRVLCALSVCSTCSGAETCDLVGTCDGTTRQRKSGGVMIQKNVATIHKASTKEEPNGEYIHYTTQITTMEARVVKLEEESGADREALRTQVADLTSAVDTMKSSGTGSLDDTTSRTTASEGELGTLSETITADTAALRQGVEALRGEYATLAKNVGEAFSSLSALQTGTAQEPSTTAAPATTTAAPAAAPDTSAAPAAAAAAPVAAAPVAAGGGLTGRTTALEARVAALENTSDKEREALKAELEALDLTVDTMKAGTAESLDQTTSRVGSGEQQVSSERKSADESYAAIRADLESLTMSVDELSAKVGAAALIQTMAEQLPLTTRIKSLATRIKDLEDKSARERGTIKGSLDTLTEKAANIKSGGVSSLEHTTLREGSLETDTAALKSYAEAQTATLQEMTTALKAKLDDVRARVGASLLESA